MDNVKQLAEATGEGYNLPIAVDSTDSYAWPWAWYLRDYKCVAYTDFASGPPQTTSCNGAERPYTVMLVNYTNRGKVDEAIARGAISGFGSPQRYPHRWWFPEGYKDAVQVDHSACTAQAGDCGPFRLDTWKTLAEGFFEHDWLTTWLRYWRDHDPDSIYPTARSQNGDDACNSCGSTDAFAFFPAAFDLKTGKLSARAAEPPRPGQDAAGRPTFGSFGTGPAQFVAPVDVETDSAGNLYVVDSRTRKLQKFDPQGNLLGAVDVRPSPADTREASEPWGLAVAPDGTVAVADTFGWRVRLFNASLQPTGVMFGEPPGDPAKEPGPYELYGPRDVAFDAQGNIWVTDTGHARLVVYDRTGRFLRSVGGTKGAGPGQFDEPVGLSIAADGTVFVADMFNARVVVLEPDGAYRASFRVDGWGGKLVTDKPYLRALGDGRVALSLPGANQVRVYDRAGNLQGNVTAPDEPVSRPYGIVETGDGKLWVVEGGSARVRQFPLP
ncbi:MAG: NHL repeat-containing protein, partial [Dehalococcoidia bacterium]|nr:NHL repeat-containing protein [Dehalococcoidia bacterium]